MLPARCCGDHQNQVKTPQACTGHLCPEVEATPACRQQPTGPDSCTKMLGP